MYTIDEINDLQEEHGSGCVGYEDSLIYAQKYTLITVNVSMLKTFNGCHLTVYNWLEEQKCTVNGKLYIDVESIATIAELITRYAEKLDVYPVVVDTNFRVLDGYHRLAAMNTINLDVTQCYFPI